MSIIERKDPLMLGGGGIEKTNSNTKHMLLALDL
jgi:hypothetical protein